MISRIAIKNFRSLRDVELRPGPLTVLIGPNGAGKSNILDALRFLKGVYSDWSQADGLLDHQLAERGGVRQVVWGGLTDENLRLEVEFSNGDSTPGTHGIEIEVAEDRERPYLSEEYHLIDSKPVSNLGDRSPTESSIPPAAMQILRRLKSWHFYNFSPALMRKPTPVRQEHVLNETGSNLSNRHPRPVFGGSSRSRRGRRYAQGYGSNRGGPCLPPSSATARLTSRSRKRVSGTRSAYGAFRTALSWPWPCRSPSSPVPIRISSAWKPRRPRFTLE